MWNKKDQNIAYDEGSKKYIIRNLENVIGYDIKRKIDMTKSKATNKQQIIIETKFVLLLTLICSA